MVVTDRADWGGWRVPGAEYDRDPEQIERQARLIAAAPRLMQLAQEVVDLVADAPEDAPPAVLALARQARDVLQGVNRVLEAAPERLRAPVAAA